MWEKINLVTETKKSYQFLFANICQDCRFYCLILFLFQFKVMQLTWLVNGTWATTSGSTPRRIAVLIPFMAFTIMEETITHTNFQER